MGYNVHVHYSLVISDQNRVTGGKMNISVYLNICDSDESPKVKKLAAIYQSKH